MKGKGFFTHSLLLISETSLHCLCGALQVGILTTQRQSGDALLVQRQQEMISDRPIRPSVFLASSNKACESETHLFMEFVKYKKMHVGCAKKRIS